MQTLEGLIGKEEKRIRYVSNVIPANYDSSSKFIGKTLTNGKTPAQIATDKEIAKELNNSLNLVRNQRNISSFDAVYRRLLPQIAEQFDRRFSLVSLDGKSDKQKFDILEKYLAKKLNRANNKVQNNSMLGTGDELKKFNGMYMKAKELNLTNRSKTMQDAIMNSDERYKQIIAKYDNDNSRYLTEKQNRDNLRADLEKISNMPRNSYTKKEMQRINVQIADSNIKLRVLKSALDKSKAMKETYETSFAETQIKAAKLREQDVRGFNSGDIGSIFDDYDIFKETMGSDGKVVRHRIDPRSMQAKEIAYRHKKFMNDYEIRMHRIRWILRKHRKIDEDFAREFERIYRGKDVKFGDSLNNLKLLMDAMDRKIEDLEKNGGKSGSYSGGGTSRLESKLNYETRNIKQKLYEDTQNTRREFRDELRTERAKLNNMKTQLVEQMNRENIKFERKLIDIGTDVDVAKMKSINTPNQAKPKSKKPLDEVDTVKFRDQPHVRIEVEDE